VGSFWYGGSNLLDGDLDRTTVGSWTVGLGLTDITFIDKLSTTCTSCTSAAQRFRCHPGLNYGSDLTTDDYWSRSTSTTST
jgi:hypothetical protein